MSKGIKIFLIVIVLAAILGALYYFLVVKKTAKSTAGETRAQFVARRAADYKLSVTTGKDKRATGADGKILTGADLDTWAAAQANWEADQKQW